MVTVRRALERLAAAEASGELARVCRAYSVDLLVLFGSAVDADDPGDIDLAVAFIPGRPRDILGLLDALAGLVPGDHLDLADLDAAGPVLLHEALVRCRVLFATSPSAFHERQIFAINHYIETRPLREALRRSLAG